MSRIEIVKEGITQLNTEAVVNAANEHLQEGGDVCKETFQAAGPTPEQQKAVDEKNLQWAWSKARDRLPQADYCVEYTDAYVFSIKDDISIGGGTSPVVVMKKTGAVMGMTAYLSESSNGRILKEHDLARLTDPNKVDWKSIDEAEARISYPIARRIAESLNPHVDACREYSDAYYFYKKDSNSDGNNGMLIMKADGSVCFSFPQFLLSRTATDQGEEREF